MNWRSPLRQSESCRLRVFYILNTLRAGFLSCMAFSICEVVHVACQSRSWFVYSSRETVAQLTKWSYASCGNMIASKRSWLSLKVQKLYGKMGNTNVQLISKHCCSTSWIAMLRVLLPTNQTCLVTNQVVAGCEKWCIYLICCKTVWRLNIALQPVLQQWSITNCTFFSVLLWL